MLGLSSLLRGSDPRLRTNRTTTRAGESAIYVLVRPFRWIAWFASDPVESAREVGWQRELIIPAGRPARESVLRFSKTDRYVLPRIGLSLSISLFAVQYGAENMMLI